MIHEGRHALEEAHGVGQDGVELERRLVRPARVDVEESRVADRPERVDAEASRFLPRRS